ncbi:MAG TPA: dephospho-CoA kinase, partial [Atopobiaceae bacterium]|nr:dephospho-CoA kinase [Atopobiaceae bacterium]
MYVVFLAGGIASGKSSAARVLEDLGCKRIDLDQISRG